MVIYPGGYLFQVHHSYTPGGIAKKEGAAERVMWVGVLRG
jgi:hypothetical protein